MGYCESVISDMQAHPFNARVQERGCGVLATLAVKSNNQVTIAAAGGIEAALSAMRAHLSNAGVQENGCRALWNLADNSNNQVTIADAGGIEAVIYAMQAHPSDAGVQGHGCWTLRNLTANSNNQVTIVAAGGIVAVTSAIPLFLFLPTYRRMASETLSILAADTNGQVAIAAAPNADVQQCGSLLGNLAVERGEFFHLLLAANTDSATAATYATYALLEKLRPEVSNCQELILFYTIANASFKKEQITLGQRNDFLESVLEAVPKMFQFDEESRVVAMLKLVLDKAVEDAIIDKNTRYRFGESYTKENVLADYRFLSLTQIVQHHGARLDRVETVMKSIDSRHSRQEGTEIVDAVCSLISIFGGIFAEGLGAAAEMVWVDTMDIVDFSDTAHIQELIVNQLGEKENDRVTALADQSMTDLCNHLTNNSDQDLLPLIGILKVSQNLSEPDLSEPDFSIISPHEASSPLSFILAKIRLSHHGNSLLENGIETPGDLADLSREQAQEIGVTEVGELIRLEKWQEVSVILGEIRLSHHGDLLLEHGIETAEDLKDLSREQAQEIGVTKVGELNRLKKWQASF